MRRPNNEAGRVTERIMAAMKRALGPINTPEYNRIYESVYEILSVEIEPVEIPKTLGDVDAFMKQLKEDRNTSR